MFHESAWYEPGSFPAQLHVEQSAASLAELCEPDARRYQAVTDLVEILQALWDWIRALLSFLDETFLK